MEVERPRVGLARLAVLSWRDLTGNESRVAGDDGSCRRAGGEPTLPLLRAFAYSLMLVGICYNNRAA